jgi:hypothetical protein
LLDVELLAVHAALPVAFKDSAARSGGVRADALAVVARPLTTETALGGKGRLPGERGGELVAGGDLKLPVDAGEVVSTVRRLTNSRWAICRRPAPPPGAPRVGHLASVGGGEVGEHAGEPARAVHGNHARLAGVNGVGVGDATGQQGGAAGGDGDLLAPDERGDRALTAAADRQ